VQRDEHGADAPSLVAQRKSRNRRARGECARRLKRFFEKDAVRGVGGFFSSVRIAISVEGSIAAMHAARKDERDRSALHGFAISRARMVGSTIVIECEHRELEVDL